MITTEQIKCGLGEAAMNLWYRIREGDDANMHYWLEQVHYWEDLLMEAEANNGVYKGKVWNNAGSRIET